ncbi:MULTISPECIES: alpha/beta hydrolase [Aerococcus]|uniref:alpha/beta hydrolase n=1 Tax=Aerococcus TaxID=1375 RepID=UPI001243C1E4|nr:MULTISPECIES: alpha/beta fold hydrolase [Aerococcus]MDL5207433.1 alpha/beta fold hydrolase [Aerococcus tenax]
MYQEHHNLKSSHPDKHPLDYYSWTADHPEAIIHYVHGMSESALRYQPMGEWFQSQGITFIAHDQVGHGPYAKAHDSLGYFGPYNMKLILVEDLYRVICDVKAVNPNVPYFLIGHSMGSFISRLFLQKYSHMVSGAILSGSADHSCVIELGKLLSPLLTKLSRPQATNFFLHRFLFGGLFTQFKRRPSERDLRILKYWYPQPEKVDYPLDGFPFTNDGFWHLIRLVDSATKKGWAKTIAPHLPLYFMNGANDFLLGPNKKLSGAYQELKQAHFQDVIFQIYEKRGHELFLYDNEEVVYRDILTWISQHRLPKQANSSNYSLRK